MPPRNDPPKKISKLLYFRGLFCQTQSQTPLLAPPTARHTEVFSFSPPCKLGGNMPPAFWCPWIVRACHVSACRLVPWIVRACHVPACRLVPWIVRACHVSACRLVSWHRSGLAMCPRAVLVPWHRQGVLCARVPSGVLASFRACHEFTHIYIIRYEKREKHGKQRKNKKFSLFLENNLFFVW